MKKVYGNKKCTIYEIDQAIMDLFDAYANKEATEEEITFLKNLHKDLDELLSDD